ncbi:hypothetical protein ACWCXH_04055 [Kitasatospora sp. NPDC001660]
MGLKRAQDAAGRECSRSPKTTSSQPDGLVLGVAVAGECELVADGVAGGRASGAGPDAVLGEAAQELLLGGGSDQGLTHSGTAEQQTKISNGISAAVVDICTGRQQPASIRPRTYLAGHSVPRHGCPWSGHLGPGQP